MAALIERLKEEADVVLFDSPPSLAVTDASVLATQTDGVLIVTDAGRTRRNLAKESVERFRQVGAPLLGVVLNRLRSGRGGYYQYYYYYYGDGKKRRRHRGLRRWLPWLPGKSKG
jgi:Mrp family chromosome partitioning ATPase